jgi:transglutaminase-like putative cysteine protease
VAEEGIGERIWTRVRDRLDCHYRARVVLDRTEVDLARLPQAPLEELPAAAVKFLMGSRYVPSEKFQRFADVEFAGLSGGARVAAMRDWIESSFAYVRGSSDEATTAVDTFVERRGICRDYAHVMIALARASGIPARMASVYAPSVEPPDFHAVAEVWLGGAWHLVDATGMAHAPEIARIGVGRDAADIPFMLVFGPCSLNGQNVAVRRA